MNPNVIQTRIDRQRKYEHAVARSHAEIEAAIESLKAEWTSYRASYDAARIEGNYEHADNCEFLAACIHARISTLQWVLGYWSAEFMTKN